MVRHQKEHASSVTFTPDSMKPLVVPAIKHVGDISVEAFRRTSFNPSLATVVQAI
jgi:hypothetical protein